MLIVLIVLGLCFGSFVNALVWRLHQKSKTKKAKLSIVNGRSICPNCKHQLSAMDLVPVISWLALAGKCRYCHKPISWQYPLVETATTLLFVLSYAAWPFNFNAEGIVLFGFWLVFLTGLMALAVYDLKWFILPDKITYKLTGLAVAQAVVYMAFDPSLNRFIGIVLGALIGGGLFYALFQVSSGRWIGGGDVKLGFLLGLVLLDGSLAAITIFSASIIGSLIAAPLMISGKMKRTTKLPFGPLLIVGAIIARLAGASLVGWYTHTILLR